MDKLSNLLASKQLPLNDDIVSIKHYVADKYSISCQVELRNQTIIITVPNASMAQTLRMELHVIKKLYSIDKRLALRIGH